MSVCEFRPGLEGIPAAQSGISFVNGQQGILEYRGIRIEELAEKSNFLETAYLLIWGKLPTKQELEEFEHEVRHHRRIKYRIRDMMKCFPESGHPMDALQASAAALGLFYARRDLDNPAYIRAAVVRLVAKIPTMVAAFQLMRKGNDPVRPRDDLDYSANFLYMLSEREPDPLAARIFDVCLILHAEHTMNASTFSARVTASTLTDPYAVVASAVGTLGGPLHGGANEEVIGMLEEIGSVENVRPYLEERLQNKAKIMGFGHRVYRNMDPRAAIMRKTCHEVLNELGLHDDPMFKLAMELERIALEDEYFVSRKLYPNVDFYSGIVMRAMGIPNSMFTAIFALARTAGWIAQWSEMNADPEHKIGRPRQLYKGEDRREFIAIEKRA